jgi:hypothetical protein
VHLQVADTHQSNAQDQPYNLGFKARLELWLQSILGTLVSILGALVSFFNAEEPSETLAHALLLISVHRDRYWRRGNDVQRLNFNELTRAICWPLRWLGMVYYQKTLMQDFPDILPKA